MGLAGHSDFSTTHRHYFAWDETVRDIARLANRDSLVHIWLASSSDEGKSLTKNS